MSPVDAPLLSVVLEWSRTGVRAVLADDGGGERDVRSHLSRAGLPLAVADWMMRHPGEIRHLEVRLPLDPDSCDALAGTCVGAVLVGFTDATAGRVRLPFRMQVEGQIDAEGVEVRPLDEPGLPQALAAFAGRNRLAGLVVGGVNSTLNPMHERRLAALARQELPLPVLEGRHFRAAPSAPERVSAAARAVAWLLSVRRTMESVRHTLARAGLRLPVRATASGLIPTEALCEASVAALVHRWGVAPGGIVRQVQARIVRASRGCYSCQCEDGRYEFESLSAAKRFGEAHLREQLSKRALEAGSGPVRVPVKIEDRYGRARGRRGSLRVYLETLIVAWVEVSSDP